MTISVQFQEKITFSIIMASFNHSKYIAEAINSVINQTYPHWELIIVDDASLDNTIEKVRPFLSDKRIKLIIHKKNKGAGKTYKDAVEMCSNTIICMLDGDDKLHPQALEILKNAYEKNHDCGFIYTTHWICNSKMRPVKISPLNKKPNPNKTNLIERTTSHLKSFRRDIYYKTQGFNPKYKMCLDGDICYKLEEKTALKFINRPLYYYRLHGAGVSIKNKRQVFLEEYLAKLDAYYRRLNSNIPNLTKNQIMLEYYKSIFFQIAYLLTILKDYFRIDHIFRKYLNKRFSTKFPIRIRQKLKTIKNIFAIS